MPRLAILVLFTAACSAGLCAADAIGWRGDGSGRFDTTVPTSLKPSWQVELGRSDSSPIVVQDCVITLADPNRVICLDTKTGAERWSTALTGTSCCNAAQQAWMTKALATPANDKAGWKELGKTGKGLFTDTGKPSQHGFTAATPVSDGSHVWVHWGFGFVACLKLADGSTVWEASHATGQLPELAHDTSPVLIDGKLLLMGPASINALDAATGKPLWTTKVKKMGHGSATPVVVTYGGQQVIVTPSGTMVDPAGKVISQVAVGGDQSPAPYAGGAVFANGDGYNRNPQFLECFDLSDPAKPTALWKTDDRRDDKGSTSTMSPLVAAGYAYVIDKSGTACWVYDLKTGKKATNPVAINGKVPGHTWRPSPAAANNAIIVPIFTGTVTLLAPDGSGKIIAQYDCKSAISGSPFCADGHLYLRTKESLICF